MGSSGFVWFRLVSGLVSTPFSLGLLQQPGQGQDQEQELLQELLSFSLQKVSSSLVLQQEQELLQEQEQELLQELLQELQSFSLQKVSSSSLVLPLEERQSLE